MADRSRHLAPDVSRRPGGPQEGTAAADGYGPVFWAAFERSANAMILVDLERRIVAANEASARLAGRSVESLTGQPFSTLLDDPAEALDDEAWRAQVLRGEAFGHSRIRRPDGSMRIVDYAMRATRVDGRDLILGICLHQRAPGASQKAHKPAALTEREREVVRRIALGEVTAEICAELHIAPDTVRTHVRNAMTKTGARTRAQLIAIALSDGLLDA
jgi:PAS domain S-box-containing protein